MTFDQWYQSMPDMDRPQFTDINGDRVVYSTDPQLWHLTDYVVSARMCELVHLIPRNA